jgi:hypothetical protein
MKVKIVAERGDLNLTADMVKVEDGFLKFKNASIDGKTFEEEAWISTGMCRCITWKGKPEDPKKEEKKK